MSLISRPLEPTEKVFNTSNITFEYESGTGFPGSPGLQVSKQGTLEITNFRIIFSSATFNFNCPLKNIKEHSLTDGWTCKVIKLKVSNVENEGLHHLPFGAVTISVKDGSVYVVLKQVIDKCFAHAADLPMYSQGVEDVSGLPDYS